MTGHIGAVVTAAGLSSRMGSFKPLLKIGNLPISERVILNFHATGIQNIVLVTGNKAAELENSLKHLDVVFLKNELYERSEMFDSVKIGLRYLKDKCDRVFVTPVDVPLFSAETVRSLLACKACVCIPVVNKKRGHPILLDGKIIDGILDYTGSGGLKGAVVSLAPETEYIDVNDAGILHDVNTQEDYSRILNLRDEPSAG
jgi:CTP:molybdopterin cytidylyltransferase MocA